MAYWDLRPLTSPELSKIEADGQSSRIGLALLPTRPVFTATVTTPPSSTDRVAQVAYTPVSGDEGLIQLDMTVFVGTEANSYNRGMCRIRKLPSGGIMFLGETSDVQWAAGLYLTVVEDWQIWARHLRIVTLSKTSFAVYMDWDVAYSDQHANCDPMPLLGPHIVKKLVGSTVQVTEFNGTEAWVYGSTIAAWLWEAPGASGTVNMDTATPVITYATTGWFRVSCTVTAANGKSYKGHRWVYIWSEDDPPVWCTFDECSGDWGSGGWTFRIGGHYDVELTSVRHRALAILFAEDEYAGELGSVGLCPGRENILAWGWLADETVVWDPDHSYVEFEAYGPHYWMQKVHGFPTGVEDKNSAATTWMEFQGLTVHNAIWHFLHWRSTVTRCIDVFPPGNDTPIGTFSSGLASLWDQLLEGAERTIKARPACDRFGRLFIQVNSQFLPVADRAGIPVVMDIERQHWRKDRTIQFRRLLVPEVGRVDLSGVAWQNVDQKGDPYFSLAPGHVMKQHGGPQAEDQLALTGQAQSNMLAGLIMGNMVNTYPSIVVPFGSNLRVFDIAPWQYGTLSVSAGDTPRGMLLSDLKIIPRRVRFTWEGNKRGGGLTTEVDFEGYTTNTTFCDGDAPPTVPAPAPPPTPGPPPPPPEPPLPGSPQIVMMILEAGSERIVVRTDSFDQPDPDWAVTLAGVHSPNYYKADYLGTTACTVEGGDNWTTLYRILNFNTLFPEQLDPLPLWDNGPLVPGFTWAFGGWNFENFSVHPDNPWYLGYGVRNHLSAQTRFNYSEDMGASWTASDLFPSESCYYCNDSSGVRGTYGLFGSTGVFRLCACCGWYGPLYDYEMIGATQGSRVEIYNDEFRMVSFRVAMGDAIGSPHWAHRYEDEVEGWIRVLQHGYYIPMGKLWHQQLQAPLQIPFATSHPGVVLGDNTVWIWDGSDYSQRGSDHLTPGISYIAPMALTLPERWALGANGPAFGIDAVVLYTDNGGTDDTDWFDKTGNLWALFQAMGPPWTSQPIKVTTIIPVLEGVG